MGEGARLLFWQRRLPKRSAKALQIQCTAPWHACALPRRGSWRYRSTMTQALPTAADVDAAAQRLAGVALRTPLVTSPALDAADWRARLPQGRDAAAHRLVQVPRRLQQALASIRPSGAPAVSSPIRPATTRRASPPRRGSSACRRVIVMPSDAPRAKRERTAALGAEVVLYDRVREDREAIAREHRRAARRRPGAAL